MPQATLRPIAGGVRLLATVLCHEALQNLPVGRATDSKIEKKIKALKKVKIQDIDEGIEFFLVPDGRIEFKDHSRVGKWTISKGIISLKLDSRYDHKFPISLDSSGNLLIENSISDESGSYWINSPD